MGWRWSFGSLEQRVRASRHDRGGRKGIASARSRGSAGVSLSASGMAWLSCWRTLGSGRRLKNQIDAAIATARAHHPFAQAGQRHVAPSRPSDRLEAQLGLMTTFGLRACVLDCPLEAARVNAASGREGFAESFDLSGPTNTWRRSQLSGSSNTWPHQDSSS